MKVKMEFFLRFEMDQDAPSEQVAETLKSVADRIDQRGYVEDVLSDIDARNLPFIRGIKNNSGNPCGEWGFRINNRD